MQLQLASLEEIERWVLGLGPGAVVVRPKVLVQRVRQAIKKMAALYHEKAGPPPEHPMLPHD